jgi:hypothetical protein
VYFLADSTTKVAEGLDFDQSDWRARFENSSHLFDVIRVVIRFVRILRSESNTTISYGFRDIDIVLENPATHVTCSIFW